MVAQVEITQLSGAAVSGGAMGTATAPATATENKNSGTLRFQRVDTLDETSLANAIPVPLSGQNYSMRVALCMLIHSSSTFTQISNPRWYSDGANSFLAGRKLWYAMTGTYTAPGIPTESNDPPQFPGATPMLDWFAATSGSPAGVPPINAGPFTTANRYVGDVLNLVFEVEAGSAPGVTPSESITLSWDEI